MTYPEFAEACNGVLAFLPGVVAYEIGGEFDGGYEDIARTKRWVSVHFRVTYQVTLEGQTRYGGGMEYFGRVTITSEGALFRCNFDGGDEQVASTRAIPFVAEIHRRIAEREAARDSVRRLVVSNAAHGGAP
jgi:hypothetical protein